MDTFKFCVATTMNIAMTLDVISLSLFYLKFIQARGMHGEVIHFMFAISSQALITSSTIIKTCSATISYILLVLI